MHQLPRPLIGLVETQIKYRNVQCALTGCRTYATGGSSTDSEQAFQARQLRLAEKAGRMKFDASQMGVSAQIMANIARPPLTKRYPVPGRSLLEHPRIFWRDLQFWFTDVQQSRGFNKILGKAWKQHLFERSFDAYKAVNEALATGNVAALVPLATRSMVDEIKTRRSSTSMAGLRMSWKLHDLVSQRISCIRQQPLANPAEKIAQVAVRFETTQSLEARDTKGNMVGKGSHSSPAKVTEVYVFQRDMWREGERYDWKMIGKLEELIDPLKPPIPGM